MSIPSFGVRKPVPVNLLMMAVLAAGLYAGLSIRRAFFPEIDPERASVSLIYPGATPEEIEETLARKVEDALTLLDEVDELQTTISEGGGGIIVEFREGIRDVDKAVDEVERAIDALQDLPEGAEKITVRLLEPQLPAIRLTAFGDRDEAVLKQTVRMIRDELDTLAGMGDIQIGGIRNDEIRIDVRFDALLEHGLSLPQVRDAVRAWMAEVPGGTVRSGTGNIRVRTLGIAERADEIRDIVIKAGAAGQAIRLHHIADVRETFVDEQIINRYQGKPAASLTVLKVGSQDVVDIADMVQAYVDGRSGQALDASWFEWEFGSPRVRAWRLGRSSPTPLPTGIQIETNFNLARFVVGRLELLTRNAIAGAVLVFATLLLFLNWRAAMWVGVGLVIAIAGTLVFMYLFDITLNLLTMFGLIIVLGLLVDDAIVVAENIQARHDGGENAIDAAVRGAEQVFWPVCATVITTIVAFLPLTFIKGEIGDLLGALPIVVAFALMMSLIESLLMLPSHMAHTLKRRDGLQKDRSNSLIHRFETARDRILFDKLVPAYTWLLRKSLKYHYISVALATALLICTFGLWAGGRVAWNFLPADDAETITVDLRMPIGTPIERTQQIVQRVETAVRAEGNDIQNISAVIGQQENLDSGQVDAAATHVAQFFIELSPVESRDRHSKTIITSIRDRLEGQIDEVERMSWEQLTGGPSGADISVRIRGHDAQLRDEAAAELKRRLLSYDGVYDVADDNDTGQREMQVELRPGGAALGFNVADVAEQVRGALYGLDAHTFSENQEDIDVRVRLDETSRRSLYSVLSGWVISPAGNPVPLSQVATVREGESYATIKRINRQRSVTVSAAVADEISPEAIFAKLDIKELRSQYPTLIIEEAGRQENQRRAFASLPIGFAAAALMIYVTLAWLFSSYTQPLAVMLAIPFGLIGAILGHMVMGFDMTFLSLIGFFALSGIVVNDSLILVEFYNELRRKGMDVKESLVEAGRQRLRAILLTTITTVLGLLPLLLEQSFQARFLIPMAISIAFGLLSTTFLILLVLPCVIVIFDDLKAAAWFLWFGEPRPKARIEGDPSAHVPVVPVGR